MKRLKEKALNSPQRTTEIPSDMQRGNTSERLFE